jgi:hypothetical protein
VRRDVDDVLVEGEEPPAQGIAGSALVLGAIVALGRRMQLLLAMAALGFFSTTHSDAHGVENPTIAEPVLYALGSCPGLAGVLIGEVALKYRAVGRRHRGGGRPVPDRVLCDVGDLPWEGRADRYAGDGGERGGLVQVASYRLLAGRPRGRRAHRLGVIAIPRSSTW